MKQVGPGIPLYTITSLFEGRDVLFLARNNRNNKLETVFIFTSVT